MTREEKNLLLQDLCGRFPYKVMIECSIECGESIDLVLNTSHIDELINNSLIIKPYLRPMSSMTEEELKELNKKYGNIAYFFIQEPPYYYGLQAQHEDISSIKISEFSEIYDWLNSHHFDYRGLISMDLALEAPEGMYN